VHRLLDRTEAALTRQPQFRIDLYVRDGTAREAPKMHATARAPRGGHECRRKARKLGQPNGEWDLSPSVGQRVDVSQFRPVLRHGARMIGIDLSQVKAIEALSPCFS
jgi:hypothetical protein